MVPYGQARRKRVNIRMWIVIIGIKSLFVILFAPWNKWVGSYWRKRAHKMSLLKWIDVHWHLEGYISVFPTAYQAKDGTKLSWIFSLAATHNTTISDEMAPHINFRIKVLDEVKKLTVLDSKVSFFCKLSFPKWSEKNINL